LPTGVIKESNSVYSEICKGIQERKLFRIEVEKNQIELEERNQQFIESSANRMIKLLGLSNIDQMHQKTGSQLKTLKILLSFYRRVKTLAEYQIKGKTKL